MSMTDAGRARAEAVFRPETGRHEKGSAMTLIADEAQATANKTAKLRALRLAREETVERDAPKPAPKTGKRPARR